MQIKFHSAAETDLQDAINWYASQKPDLDTEFMQEVDKVLIRIAENPAIFPIVLDNTRKALLNKFPYALYFDAGEEKIMVLAVFHFRRNPTIWQSRINK